MSARTIGNCCGDSLTRANTASSDRANARASAGHSSPYQAAAVSTSILASGRSLTVKLTCPTCLFF